MATAAPPFAVSPERLIGRARRVDLAFACAGLLVMLVAMAMLMAKIEPELSETEIFDRLLQIRPKAWPNLRMMTFADELMRRNDGFVKALGAVYRRQLIAYPNIRDLMRDNGRSRELALADAA